MAVALVSTPDPFALTKGGRMLYQFSGTGRYQTQGVKASAFLFVSIAIPNNTPLTLRWNGADHTLHFVNAPSAPNEFSAGSGDAAHLAILLDELTGYFPLREDFVLTSGSVSGQAGIVLTARKPGPAYDISVNLPVSTPFGFGNSTFGAAPLLRTQYSVYGEVWLQKVGTSGNDLTADFERVFVPTIETDSEGNAQFDVGSVLHSHLVADWPSWTLNAPTLSQTSARKYFLCYGEAYGSPLQVGRVYQDEVRHALLGGVDYQHRAGGGLNLLFSQTSDPADDKALRFGSDTRFVRPDEPQFLTFLNSRDDQMGCLLRITRTFDNDETDVRMSLLAAQDVLTGQKITYCVGVTQQDLLSGLPNGRTLKEYTVQRIDADQNTPLSIAYRYIVNYDYQLYTRYFGYLNSLGAVETLATFGKGSNELNRFYEQAERYLPALYELADGQFVDYNVSLQQSVEVVTGFRAEAELRSWNDFYRSPNRFRLIEGKALPVSITSKSIKQAKDGDTLLAHKFEYVYGYKDDFYSEDQSSPMGLPPLGFVSGGGSVVVQPQTILRAIDDTVPDAVRGLTATLINRFQQAFAWGNHALAGYLNQSSASALFRRTDTPISYVTDLSDKPTTRDEAGLTDVPTRHELVSLIHITPRLTSWTGANEPPEIV